MVSGRPSTERRMVSILWIFEPNFSMLYPLVLRIKCVAGMVVSICCIVGIKRRGSPP